jgi:hypothetical protein
MGLEKFPHPQLGVGIPVVSNCYRGDGSSESIPDGDLPIAIIRWDQEERSPRDESAQERLWCWARAHDMECNDAVTSC